MEITVTIETCNDCRHISHSGSYTVGGPLPVCHHSKAINHSKFPKKGFKTVEEVKVFYGLNSSEHFKCADKEEVDSILKKSNHWIHRMPFADWKKPAIPDWCPLKHGEKY